MNTETLLIVMVVITGLSVVLQAIVIVAVLVVLTKAVKVAKSESEELRSKIGPIVQSSKELIDTTRALVARIEPEIVAAATDLAEITETAKVQVGRIQEATDEITARMRDATDDIADRVRVQTARVDGMTTSVLNSVDRVGGLISQAVAIPVRQISSVLAGVRAAVDTLRGPTPRRAAGASTRVVEVTEEKDIFI